MICESNVTEFNIESYDQGWNDCLEAVRASLKGWPEAGCDIVIGEEVERIIAISRDSI